MKRLLKPIKSRKAYSPRKVMLLGNHEERLDRAANDAAEYEGTIGTHLLPYQEWETKKFKVPFSFGGFVACHYFPSGDMGRPIGGVNVARALLQKGHQSCVVGHNHRLDVATDTRFDGRKVTSISAGCLTHPDSKEGWNISTEPLYWRGVVILNGVKNGDYRSMSLISYQEFA